MLYNVIGKAGDLKAHKDENVGRVIGCKFPGQENRTGVYNIIDILKFMVMGEITWERVSRE